LRLLVYKVLRERCMLKFFWMELRKGLPMKEPGLDNRHRDKTGQIQQKRSDTIHKNLSTPIPEFALNTTLGHIRKVTGKVSEQAVRRAAKKLK